MGSIPKFTNLIIFKEMRGIQLILVYLKSLISICVILHKICSYNISKFKYLNIKG